MNYLFTRRRAWRGFWTALGAAVLIFTFAGLVLSQTETGQILGTVTDASGGIVPKAKVTVRNVATTAERLTTTDDRGEYVVTNLLPATYVVIIEAQGFARMERRIQVAPGARAPLDFTLSVGKVTEVVEVTGTETVAVNTETQTLATVIDRRSIEELPLLTRNPYNLIGTAGNTTSADDAGVEARGGGFQVNGLRAASNNILLDGASNNDEFVADFGQAIPLDSVQEFSILTNNFTAEYGRAAGAVVNLVTKSGSNDFHGSAYLFGRYSALAANDFDSNANDLPKAVFTRNQFGYSVGGPVIKNKLFFFQSTEWLRVRSAANTIVAVPTPQLIGQAASNTQAFFTAFGALRSNFAPVSTATKADFGTQACEAAGTCPAFAALASTFPMFTIGQYTVPSDAGAGNPVNDTQVVGRVDWNISSKTQLYGRYALQKNNFLEGVNTNSPYAGFDTASTNMNNNFLISVTHTLSPTVVSQSKLVFNRLNNQQPLGANPVGPTLFMFGATTARVLGQRISFPGYSTFTPGNAIPFGGPQNYVQAYQDFSHIRGKHNFRFGGSYVYIRDNRAFGAYEEGVETLSTITNNGLALNNFLLGQLQQFQAAIDPQGKFPCGATVTPQCTVTLPVQPPSFSRSNRYHEFAFYGQDSWRVTPRFTLNLGLRWEYFGVQHNKNPKLDSNYYDAAVGNIFTGIRQGDVATVPDSPIKGLWKKDWNNFAPRIGFAWDIFGNGKTSLRGGWGISYERNFGNVTFNVIQNPPAYAVISIVSNQDVPGFIPISTDNAGPLGGSTGSKALPGVSLRNVNSNLVTAYAHLWSASLEREVVKNLFLGVDYTGSKGEQLYSIENPNIPGAGNVYLGDCVTGPGCGITRLRTTQFTNINRRGNGGLSIYNALNVRVNIRNIGNSGLNLQSNYTWAHSIDNLSSTFSESNNDFNLGLLDPFDPKLDRGNSAFDIRHRFVVSGTWDLPIARHSAGFVNRVFNGWTLAPIFTAQTGNAYTMFDCSNAVNICPRAMTQVHLNPEGGVTQDLGGNAFVYYDMNTLSFDTSFVNPIINRSDIGPFPSTMLQRGYFRGPGKYNVDLGIYKTTKITERFSVQIRGEFFNMFNHSNLYVVPGDFEVEGAFVTAKRGVSPSQVYGTPNERRNVQVAVRLLF